MYSMIRSMLMPGSYRGVPGSAGKCDMAITGLSLPNRCWKLFRFMRFVPLRWAVRCAALEQPMQKPWQLVRADDLDSGLLKGRCQCGRRRRVSDKHVHGFKWRDFHRRDAFEFGGIRDDNGLLGTPQHGLFHLGIIPVVFSEGGASVQATHAEEEPVGMEHFECAMGQFANHRGLTLPYQAPWENQTNIRQIHKERGDREAGSDDREIAAIGEAASDLVGRGAHVNGERFSLLHQVRRHPGDALFLLDVHGVAQGERGFVEATASAHTAAVNPLDEFLLLQLVEIAPDGHFCDIEMPGQIGDPGGALRLDCREYGSLTLYQVHDYNLTVSRFRVARLRGACRVSSTQC